MHHFLRKPRWCCVKRVHVRWWQGGRLWGRHAATVPLSEFNNKHSTQLGVTGATLDLTDDYNTKQRPSRQEKAAAKDARECKKAAKARAIQDKAAAASAAAEAHSDGAVEQCPHCHKFFMTSGWYNRHASIFCPNRSEQFEARRKARRADVILQLHDVRALQ
jgi:hypothetical protein